MSVSKDEIKEALSSMPVMELVGLISELEEQWGVSAAASGRGRCPQPVRLPPLKKLRNKPNSM